MNCDELLHRLTDYAERALSEDACAALEAHLAGCLACSELCEELRLLRKLCRETQRPCMPEAVRRRLRALVDVDY